MAQSITLQNLADTAIVNNDILGQLCFAAPNEAGGTDSILIAASIFARSEGTFAADNNATELVFTTGASESAAPGATNYDMTLSSAGNLTVAGTIECATSLTIGSAAMVEADLEFLDGITAGTAAASKAVVLDGSKNIATIGTIGCGAITSTGSSSFATSVKTPLIEYTDGDDSMTIADGGKVTFAAGFAVGSDAAGDILYHNGTSYVRLAKGSDDEVLTLASGLPSWAAAGGGSGDITAVVAGTGLTGGATSGSATVNVIGGDGITANANDVAITAAQTTVTSVYNASLKMGRDSQNLIDFATTDDKIILRVANVDEVELVANVLSPVTSDGVALGTGSLMWSDLFLASASVINFNNGDVTLTHSGNTLTVAGGTLATAALTASTGTFSGVLKTDDATDATSTTDGSLQTDGGLSVAKDCIFGNDVKLLTDSSVLSLGVGSDATFTHDGTTGLTIAANPITLDSGAAINIEPASGSVILLDGTISIDAGVVTGATSITSTAFVGTLSTAAQANITSLGTLTTLTVDSIIINGTTIGHTSDTDAITIAAEGDVTFSKAIKPAAPAAASGTSGIVVLNCNTTNHFTITTGGNITGWNFTNASTGQRIIVRVTNGASHTVAFSATGDGDVVYFPGGTEPTLTTSGGIDVYGFLCVAADTFDGFILGQDIKA